MEGILERYYGYDWKVKDNVLTIDMISYWEATELREEIQVVAEVPAYVIAEKKVRVQVEGVTSAKGNVVFVLNEKSGILAVPRLGDIGWDFAIVREGR